MRTVGQILKQERENKNFTLDQVEKATKIRQEMLAALEGGQYAKLPPATFVQGFIKNYAKFLNLDSEKLLAIYRREFSEHKNPPRILESFTNPIDRQGLRLTPAKVLTTAILGLIVIFFAYLWYEYRFLVGAPFLTVDQPADQISVIEDQVKVVGRTDPEAKVAINNQEIAVDVNGKFSQEIKLSDSSNLISIVATSKSGKTAKIERTVFLRKQ